jgi:two-component system sensor histidine kinase SenX3
MKTLLPLSVTLMALPFTAWWSRRAEAGPGTEAEDAQSPATEDLSDATWQARRALQAMEQMAEGVVVLDPDLRIVFTNHAARRLLGIKGEVGSRLPNEEMTAVARLGATTPNGTAETIQVWYPTTAVLSFKARPLDDGVVLVVQDVTEQTLIQRMRRDFVTHASHELKTPVASLQTLAEAVSSASLDDPEAVQRFSARLVTEAERLSSLIADLLDLSRLEEGYQQSHAQVDLSRIVQNEVDLTREIATVSDISIELNATSGALVLGDSAQLSLMCRNLLQNAVQHTSDDGRVVVSVRREASGVVFEVEDFGRGIPREMQSRIFERFYRVDPGRSRDSGGTGLGLAIVKHAAESHGGSVSVDSEVGRGSRFIVHLPASKGLV